MSPKSKTLDKLRREIDAIDNGMLELLAKRTDVVERIRAAKAGKDDDPVSVMHPDREARIIRRILSNHDSRLPEVVVARVWRELISAFTRLQSPLKVAVCAPEKSVGYWDLARMHFGSATPMSLHRSIGVVLREISETQGAVGILPLPEDGEDDPWWTHLATEMEDTPRVIARLPFVQDQQAWFEGLGALAVSNADHGDSGDEISLLVIAADPQMSRARLNERLVEVKLQGHVVAAVGKGGDRADWLHLVEVEGYVGEADARVKAFLKKADGAVDRVIRIGGYAAPYKIEPQEG